MMKNLTRKKPLRKVKIKKIMLLLSRQLPRKSLKKGNQKKNCRNVFIPTPKQTGMKNRGFCII